MFISLVFLAHIYVDLIVSAINVFVIFLSTINKHFLLLLLLKLGNYFHWEAIFSKTVHYFFLYLDMVPMNCQKTDLLELLQMTFFKVRKIRKTSNYGSLILLAIVSKIRCDNFSLFVAYSFLGMIVISTVKIFIASCTCIFFVVKPCMS